MLCILPLVILATIGHACIWCPILNYLYGCPLSKTFLRTWRLLTGIIIVALPVSFLIIFEVHRGYHFFHDPLRAAPVFAVFYGSICFVIATTWFPLITFLRFGTRHPFCVVDETSTRRDLWPVHGPVLLGDGKYRRVAALPLNDIFNVEFTELKLKLETLPPALDGLTILLLTDFHFCGTPSQTYFDAILKEIESQPTPDIVALGGDYVDSLEHHAWIVPLLSRLKWNDAGIAILGNHDAHYQPDAIREQVTAAGFTMLANRWQPLSIRGVDVLFFGHEGPWFPTTPDRTTSGDIFKICLSHTPDNFYWAVRNHIDLVLAGHVHGGQIRLPVIGSIFVPSKFGRRFDQGVFQKMNTAMVVSRGLSGKEPLRFRCPPQVIRITLTMASRER